MTAAEQYLCAERRICVMSSVPLLVVLMLVFGRDFLRFLGGTTLLVCYGLLMLSISVPIPVYDHIISTYFVIDFTEPRPERSICPLVSAFVITAIAVAIYTQNTSTYNNRTNSR